MPGRLTIGLWLITRVSSSGSTVSFDPPGIGWNTERSDSGGSGEEQDCGRELKGVREGKCEAVNWVNVS